MNKKLMALAVAAAVTAPGLAVAQTSNTPTAIVPSPGLATSNGITLYGRLDETIMMDRYSANGANTISSLNKQDLFTAGNAMGFRGREDLGGGMTAWFQLEIGVWPDGRTEAGATIGNNWGGRNSGVGLSGAFGDVLAGVWDTPYKVVDGVWNSVTSGGFSAAGVIMNVGDSTGALLNPSCTNTVSNASGSVTTTAGGVCVTEATSNGTAFSRRINNSIQYWSPIMAGFQVKLMTALANYQAPDSASTNGVTKPKEYSASATYVRGPLSVGFGYDQHQGLRPAGTNFNAKDTGMQLGAKFNFGPGEVGAAYEQIKYGDNGASGMKVPAWVVNGRFNVGPGAVWASYANSQGGKDCTAAANTIGAAACGAKAKEYSLGYDYVLSKRTKLYVAYNKIDNSMNGAGTGTSYYYIAGPATNSGNGTAGALAQGVDVTTYGLGVQHVF
ncbi:MAG TPA: porin [Burkholderiales bacterium]|jgi:predicted porin|nr:porin [Burkholderiales bacterium]